MTALDVSTAQGTVRSDTAPGEDLQSIAVPPGPTSWIRISFASVDTSDETIAGAGIREIDLPGITVDQRLAVPQQLNEAFSDPATNLPAYVFQRVTTDPRALLRRDEEPDMHRRFDLPRDGTLNLSATVSPVASPELLDLVNRTSTFDIHASSTLGDLPGYGARNLLDGKDSTIWIAEGSPLGNVPTSTVDGTTVSPNNTSIAGTNPSPAADDAPSLHLSWDQPRVIPGLKLTAVPGYSSPASVRIETPQGVIDAPVEADGTVKFWPVVTSEMTLTFPRVSRYAVTTGLGEPKDRPLALSSIHVPGLDDLTPAEIDRSTPVTVPCSEGPAATIDGVTHRFSVTTTVGQLLDFRDVPATPCDGAVTLTSGPHKLDTAQGSSPLSIRTVKLASTTTAAALATPTTSRKTSIIAWGDTRRRVEIAPGQASYLLVHESSNPGWKATLDGQTLTPVTIDGWQQGYLVPEGDGGTITLAYAPTTTYRASILLGGAFVVLLLGLALVRSRKTEPAPLEPGRVAPVLLWLVAGGAMLAVGGPIGLLVLAGVWAIRFRWRGAPALIAGGAFAVATVFVAVTQGLYREDFAGAFGVPATLVSIVAIAAVAGTILPVPARFRRSEDNDDLGLPAPAHGAPPPPPQQ